MILEKGKLPQLNTELQQTTNQILMVRPANFGFNTETAESNAFQKLDTSLDSTTIKKLAIQEFDNFVEKLEANGISIVVIEDTPSPAKPDAVFPNNWITSHQNGSIFLFPMFASARRLERRKDIIAELANKFVLKKEQHLEFFERNNKFLEGTGSMVLDRVNKIVYACVSNRTDPSLIEEFCLLKGFSQLIFNAEDENGVPIYHTNVIMSLGETFSILCLDCVKDIKEQEKLLTSLRETNKEVISITFDQVRAFAGNMLQVRNDKDETFLVMSEQAYLSLTEIQKEQILKHTNILFSPINTIETFGGGSVRCMMAEIFLEPIASDKLKRIDLNS